MVECRNKVLRATLNKTLLRVRQRKTTTKNKFQDSSTLTPRHDTVNLLKLRLCYMILIYFDCGMKHQVNLRISCTGKIEKKLFILDITVACIRVKCIWNKCMCVEINAVSRDRSKCYKIIRIVLWEKWVENFSYANNVP